MYREIYTIYEIITNKIKKLFFVETFNKFGFKTKLFLDRKI